MGYMVQRGLRGLYGTEGFKKLYGTGFFANDPPQNCPNCVFVPRSCAMFCNLYKNNFPIFANFSFLRYDRFCTQNT